jgi:hypothetical protein
LDGNEDFNYLNNIDLFRGVFTIYLSIEFYAKWNKSDLVTNWFLSFNNTGNHKMMEIEFQKSTDHINNNLLL